MAVSPLSTTSTAVCLSRAATDTATLPSAPMPFIMAVCSFGTERTHPRVSGHLHFPPRKLGKSSTANFSLMNGHLVTLCSRVFPGQTTTFSNVFLLMKVLKIAKRLEKKLGMLMTTARARSCGYNSSASLEAAPIALMNFRSGPAKKDTWLRSFTVMPLTSRRRSLVAASHIWKSRSRVCSSLFTICSCVTLLITSAGLLMPARIIRTGSPSFVFLQWMSAHMYFSMSAKYGQGTVPSFTDWIMSVFAARQTTVLAAESIACVTSG
mmetsp:Transcript_44376/g.73970  ORF Transcript_44376/g.73970 Transcript_44376/m.73970 type:complete len:266 (-) Transcript_44376:242-1039(-)